MVGVWSRPGEGHPLAPPPRSRPRLPLPRATTALCAWCVVVFLGITAAGGPSWETLARWGYLPASRVWDGAYWVLLSSAFVHFALWHVAFNVYWLWILGGVVERALGSLAFVGVVAVAAVVSSSVQLGVSGATGIGASGVVYALFGLMWAARKRVPVFGLVLGDRLPKLFWIWLVGCIVATHFGLLRIGNGAHVGGVIFGMLVGSCLGTSRARRALTLVATVAFVATSLVPAFWSPWSPDWVGYQASKAHKARDYDAAIEGYRRSISLGGDRAWALANMALAYAAKGAARESAETLAQLRSVDPAAAATVEERIGLLPGATAAPSQE